MKSIFAPSDLTPFQAILIDEAKAYLAVKGWRIEGRHGDKALIYSHPSLTYTAMLPLKPSFSDYAIRISELVSAIAESENRDERDVLRDISLSSFDVLRIRLVDSVRLGTVSLEATRHLVDEARELFLSSASSCINPKRIFGSKRAREAEDYIRKVRLGQTEVGSYVFTVLSPVILDLNSTMPLPFEVPIAEKIEPFERKVTNMLYQALSITNQSAVLAQSEGSIEAFSDTAKFGVSTNFCDAIHNISKNVGTVDFQLTWGAVRPRASADNAFQPIRFTPQLADIVEEASKQFKAIEPRPSMTIKGYVYHLEKDKLDPSGNVLIKGNIDGEFKTIKVALSDEDYIAAIRAHENYLTISVEGDLIQRPRMRFLNQVRNFRIDSDDKD